jgi:hypothetical protein
MGRLVKVWDVEKLEKGEFGKVEEAFTLRRQKERREVKVEGFKNG